MKKKREREEREQRQSATSFQESAETLVIDKTVQSDLSSESDQDIDFNENKPVKKKLKPKTITLEVPRNILKQTTLTAARFSESARCQTMMLASIIMRFLR